MTGKEGYFLAKQQITDTIYHRTERLEEIAKKLEQDGDKNGCATARAKIYELEKLRSYVRNVMLWCSDNDKN